MATIEARKGKSGEITSYRLRACVGRNEQYKQVWRTCTIPRPEGLTPAKERKEVQRIADEWETTQKAEYERTHRKEDKSKITLADFIRNHWWPDNVKDGSHKPSTVDFFKYMSDDIISYFGEQKRLAQIDAEAIKRYVKYLNTEARTKSGNPYSKTTIQHHYKTLRNIFEYARRFRYVKEDPCNDLSAKDKPCKGAKKIDFLDADEARRFMRCLDGEPIFWRTYMNVLLTCGLRRGECTGLQWRDINQEKLTLTVARNVTPDKTAPDKYRIGTPKTGEERTVPISSRVCGLLMELKKEQEEHFQVKLFPGAFIFCRDTSPWKPIYPSVPTRWQRRFVERNNLPNVSPHDLRHTAATLALESGANLKDVQQLLGHSDPGTTLEFYTGVTEEAQRRTVEGIESLIK